MSGRPGVTIVRENQQVVPGISTDSGTAFFVGLVAAGDEETVVRCESLADFHTAHTSASNVLRDSVQAFFGEGGALCYVVGVNSTDTDDADWAAALALFSAELGPGQVCAPGETTATRYGQLFAHAAATNRVVLIDSDEDDDATAVAASASAAAALANVNRSALFAQWLSVPEEVAGVPRTVPPSGVVAGLCARLGDEPNVWPIADRGQLRYCTAATVEFTDAERTTLTTAGANVFLDDPGGLRLYGFRSASDDPAHRDFGHARLDMRIEAEARAIGERFVGVRITPAKILEFIGALEGYLHSLYQAGALAGTTAAQAYRAAGDPPINTDDTAAAGELHAEIYRRAAGHAESVRILSVSVPTNGNVN